MTAQAWTGPALFPADRETLRACFVVASMHHEVESMMLTARSAVWILSKWSTLVQRLLREEAPGLEAALCREAWHYQHSTRCDCRFCNQPPYWGVCSVQHRCAILNGVADALGLDYPLPPVDGETLQHALKDAWNEWTWYRVWNAALT